MTSILISFQFFLWLTPHKCSPLEFGDSPSKFGKPNGIQIPGVDLAFKIADFFNVTVEFLYYETNFSGSIKTDQEFNEFTEHLQRLMKYLKL